MKFKYKGTIIAASSKEQAIKIISEKKLDDYMSDVTRRNLEKDFRNYFLESIPMKPKVITQTRRNGFNILIKFELLRDRTPEEVKELANVIKDKLATQLDFLDQLK